MNSPEPQDDGDQNDEIIRHALFYSLVAAVVLLIPGGYFLYRHLTRTETVVTEDPRPVQLPDRRELPQVQPPATGWTDITQLAGITFVHQNGATGEKLLPETMGGGCAFFDYDGDGDQDLLFINSHRWPWDPALETAPPATLTLYANDGTGKFTDVTSAAGLDLSIYGMGVACGDYDGDGDIDLFVSGVNSNLLLRNDAGRFVDVTAEAGIASGEGDWGTSCGWFDFDRDGDLDLFVCHYVAWSREFDQAQNFRLAGGERAYGRPQNFTGRFCTLYRNEGNGKFADVSAAAGLHVINDATGQPMGKSLALVFEDFNGDGWLDVVVANDTVQNFLFVNQQDGTFREMGAVAGIAFDLRGAARGAMGTDASSFRNDGALGVAIGNFSNEMTALYVSRSRNLQFYDEAVANGLGPATRLQLSFGVLFLDYDLDGRLDLFQANGHLEEDIQKVQASQRYEQSPQLFWNAGKDSATEYLLCDPKVVGSDFDRPLVGRGAAYADIDGDGDLDLIVTASGQRPRLLRNDQQLGHHWLRVKLKGKGGNVDGLGALVELSSGNVRQARRVSPTRSYLSQVELPVTFGLGASKDPVELTIHWPNGDVQTETVVELDRLVVIEQIERPNPPVAR